MSLPTPQIFKNQNFQAWGLVILIILVGVLVYNSTTGKNVLSKVLPGDSKAETV